MNLSISRKCDIFDKLKNQFYLLKVSGLKRYTKGYEQVRSYPGLKNIDFSEVFSQRVFLPEEYEAS